MLNTIKTPLIFAAILVLGFLYGPSWSEPATLEAEAQTPQDAAPEAEVNAGSGADGVTKTIQESQTTQRSQETQAESAVESRSMAQFEVAPESQTTERVEVKPDATTEQQPSVPTTADTNQPRAEPQAPTLAKPQPKVVPEPEPTVAQEPKTQLGAKQKPVLEAPPTWQYWSPWASRYRYRQYLDELRDERREYVRARTEAMREHRDRYRSARRWWSNPWAESRRRWWDAHSDYGRDLSEQRYGYRRTQRESTRDYMDSFGGPGAWGPYGVYGDPWSYAPGSWGPYPW